MEQQVIFRDRQEFQAADLLNLQKFADDSLGNVILDAITSERMIVGMNVSQVSATEVQIDSGRLWCGDLKKVFAHALPTNLSIFSYLPIEDEKFLALSVLGQEQEEDIEPRDFLIDVQSAQTEPRAVAMRLVRVVVAHIVSGLESTEPQRPEPPTGYSISR